MSAGARRFVASGIWCSLAPMKSASVLALGLACLAAPGRADDSLTIPPAPIDAHPQPSIWNGLYVGTD